MDPITHTKARKNFVGVMNKVCDDNAPVIITRQSERPVVMMSQADYNAIEETLYLLRSPKNAARLSKAVKDIEGKKYKKRTLANIE